MLAGFSRRRSLSWTPPAPHCDIPAADGGPFQQHQLGLRFTKTLVMPPGYQRHKRANWKQITHTLALVVTLARAITHTHRRVDPLAGHCRHSCTDTCTQYHTLNYPGPYVNTLEHWAAHTHLRSPSFRGPSVSPKEEHLGVRGRGSVHCFLWRACETLPTDG